MRQVWQRDDIRDKSMDRKLYAEQQKYEEKNAGRLMQTVSAFKQSIKRRNSKSGVQK